MEVKFTSEVTYHQVRWLLTTDVPLRSLTFSTRPNAPAACIALQQQVCLQQPVTLHSSGDGARDCLRMWYPP